MFKKRADVKLFMDMYIKREQCQYVVHSGCISEECQTKKVGVLSGTYRVVI